MIASALTLPVLSPAEAKLSSLMSQRQCSMALVLFEQSVSTLRLHTLSQPVVFAGMQMTLECQGHQFECLVDKVSVSRLLGDFDSMIDLPEDLLIALLQQALDRALTQLEALLRATLEIVAIRFVGGDDWRSDKDSIDKESGRKRNAFVLPLEISDDSFHGYWHIAIDDQSLEWVTEQVKQFTTFSQNPLSGDPSALPIILNTVIGSTRLNRHQLSSLAVGDIILMEQCYSKNQQCCIRLNPSTQWLADINQGKITVLTAMDLMMNTDVMNENTGSAITMPEEDDMAREHSADTENGTVDIDQLKVNLEFRLGDLSIDLAQLQRLGPGYVFDLGLDINAPVWVKANGMTIGRCALVDIENRVGAQITEIFTGSSVAD